MARESGSAIIPILVVGGVGYYLYQSGLITKLLEGIGINTPVLPAPDVNTNTSATPKFTPPIVTSVVSGGVAQVTSDAPAPTSNVVPTGSLKDRMLNYITKNNWLANGSTKTFDEWNWLVGQVGVPSGLAVEDVFPGADRSTQYYLDGFLAGLQTKGISGIGSGGLGMILNWGDFYSQQPRKSIRGNFK